LTTTTTLATAATSTATAATANRWMKTLHRTQLSTYKLLYKTAFYNYNLKLWNAS
jgi:hypothetical protein